MTIEAGLECWLCAACIAARRLEFGHIENGGLRCCYHGWLYDVEGKVLETPGEPPASTFKERVRQPAYKAQELGGVIFVYMGPEPAPLLPSYDVLVREDGVRARRARTVNCNFFQMIENSVDQNHLKWLHRTAKTPDWDDGEIDPQLFEYGILNTYTRRVAGKKWAHCNFFVMPTMNKTGNVEEGHPTEHRASSAGEVMRWRVPIDDTALDAFHSRVRRCRRRQAGCQHHERRFGGGALRDSVRQSTAGMNPSVGLPEKIKIGWRKKARDRSTTGRRNTLVYTDRGVILLRRFYKESIEAVKRGGDPIGVIRDPEKNRIIRLEPHEDLLD